MAAIFEQDGVRFQYPENWELTRDENPNGWTVTVQSPSTAFFMVTFDAELPEAELMAETALETMRAEYANFEADPVQESIAGQPACGHDMRFFSLDLTNTCCTRALYTAAGTVLLFWQTTDLDLDLIEPVIQAIRASLRVEED